MAMSKRHTSGICIATSCHSSQVAWTVHPHSQSSEAPTSRHFHKSPASKADTVVTPWCFCSLVHAPASFPGMPRLVCSDMSDIMQDGESRSHLLDPREEQCCIWTPGKAGRETCGTRCMAFDQRQTHASPVQGMVVVVAVP